MRAWVALLRGINVAGRNKLPMADLRSLLQTMGADRVRTYIQSGNAVFLHDGAGDELAERIAVAVHERSGFRPHVQVMPAGRLERALSANPFPRGVDEPKHLHFYFLAGVPDSPDLERLEGLRAGAERFALEGDVFYLHAPEGIARSKLATAVETALDVPATARNLRTVYKLRDMLEDLGN